MKKKENIKIVIKNVENFGKGDIMLSSEHGYAIIEKVRYFCKCKCKVKGYNLRWINLNNLNERFYYSIEEFLVSGKTRRVLCINT